MSGKRLCAVRCRHCAQGYTPRAQDMSYGTIALLYRYRSEPAFPLIARTRQGRSCNSLFGSSGFWRRPCPVRPTRNVTNFLASFGPGDKVRDRAIYPPQCSMDARSRRRYLKDEGLAEDCVQESLLSALRNLDKFEQRCEVKTWLHRIVVNYCLMKLRSVLRAQEQPIDHLLPKFDANGGRVETPWSQIATPDEALEQRQMSALVRAKISELPDGYRIVLLLRDIEELSTQEVAQLLGLSGAAVKVRLHRARSSVEEADRTHPPAGGFLGWLGFGPRS